MPTLIDARSVEEDWSGLKDPKARRKLQNRINVRAHRRRKATTSQRSRELVEDSPQSQAGCQYGILKPVEAASPTHKTRDDNSKSSAPRSIARLLHSRSPNTLQFFGQDASDQSLFPLTSDHLLPLVQYNLLRASLTNSVILALHDQLPPSDCGFDLRTMVFFPNDNDVPFSRANLPVALRPTALQCSIPHELWLDLVPDPTLRDNLLLALRDKTMDAIDLQVDIFGSICEQKVETQRRRLVMGDTSTPMAVIMREQRRLRNLSEEGQIGILVWSDPWDTSGYELTEAFVNKWSHILKGCWKLLEATNRWRAIRGEKPIFANL